jgi:transglutaminase-like putative cysteine protease
MGWQLLMVCLFGPLLMFLMPAKMARRQKHVGDYWSLQAIGLAVVALAGAMAAEESVCLALIVAYAVFGVWSLTLFFLARSTGAVPPIPPRHPEAAPAEVPARPVGHARPRSGSRELARGVLWLGLAVVAVTPVYLLTPRSSAAKLSFGQQRMEIGYAGEQMIDLNKVGNLQPNPEPAFEVTAQAEDGRPTDDLNLAQRWRGATLVDYRRGTWEPDRFGVELAAMPMAFRKDGWSPPNLGPGQYRLTFTVPGRLTRGGTPVLADPIVWAAGQPAPVASLEPNARLVSWHAIADGTFAPPLSEEDQGPRRVRRTLRYVQVTRPQADPDLGSAFEPRRPHDFENTMHRLTHNPVPRVKEYADGVLDRLVRAGRLPADARRWEGNRLHRPEAHHEAIAREFGRHLVNDAGLTYTLNLRREFKDMDPVEEFLYHNKSGHCERFASALVLMLRSQGIPAVMVLGFRGCDSLGDGKYVVRQESAHAWAQVLVSRPKPDGTGRAWHWLSVDPNPGGSEGTAESGWLSEALNTAWSLVDQYVLHYTPESRDRALGAIRDALVRPSVFGWLGAGVVLVAGVRRLRRRAARAAAPPQGEPSRWFGQLLAVLAAHGFAPQLGQTAREFAAEVGEALRDRAGAAAVADVPTEWAEAYYAARFGDAPLEPDRKAELERRLADLRRALGR